MRLIKLSDYVAEFLVKNGISHLFLISGGGMMHLLDSAAKNEELSLVYNLNEQATGICAESYGQFTNHLGACMLTTGPGATNAVTGCAGAWVDSTPVMYISGQCRIDQMGQLNGLRIYGAQEIAIIPVVKPITKYAVTVLKKEEIKYHLEKALYLATHGRKGPVWLDIPLDIQGSMIDVDELEGYDPCADEDTCVIEKQKWMIDEVYSLLNDAKRPIILAGHGVISSNQQELLRKIAEEFAIPVVTTWRAKGIFGDEEELFMGEPGIPGVRYANYAVQNADLVIILGTRLNPAITAYDEPHFACNAKKVMVDIEQKEIDKLDIAFDVSIRADITEFLPAFYAKREQYFYDEREEWHNYCRYIKEKYPISKERQPIDNGGKTDGYQLAQVLSTHSSSEDVFVGSSSGRACGISHMAYSLKKDQRFVTSMGIGSMGWCVPSAIACCFASGKKRTIVIEGDGSLQHNIQELALINNYNLPLKIFVLNNGGYASIYMMQRNNFAGNYAGCDSDSGLGFPSIQAIAKAYNIAYHCIENDAQIKGVVKDIMKDSAPTICEVHTSIFFDEIPKSMTIANPDGTFSSSKLENLYPFVSDEDQALNMPKWRD